MTSVTLMIRKLDRLEEENSELRILLAKARVAIWYHREQTRPIELTDDIIYQIDSFLENTK